MNGVNGGEKFTHSFPLTHSEFGLHPPMSESGVGFQGMIADGHNVKFAIFIDDFVVQDGGDGGTYEGFGGPVEPFHDLTAGDALGAASTDAKDELIDGILEFTLAVRDG